MITRLLLGVDSTPSSDQAARLALDLAAAHGAAVEALAAIDTPWITSPMAGGIGGSAYKVAAEIAQLRRAHAEAEAALAALRTAAAGRDLACEARLAEGSPPDLLAEAAVTSDVIVLGRDASFWGKDSPAIAPAVEEVLRRNPRPVLVAPEAPITGARMLVAFDGSRPASRALHMAALLGIGAGRPIVVLSVAADAPLAQARSARAAQLLRAHGGAVEDVLAIHSAADPAEIIIDHVQSLHIGLAAMGAYGHTGLREMLLGSATRTLLRACPTALFVYH